MEMRLDGKVAVVTGGSRGIGRSIAARFATAGASVMIVSRNAETLEKAAADIGHGCRWISANVGDPDAAAQTVATAVEQLGSLDILVNNAATNPYAGRMIDVDLPRWEKTLQINLTAPLVWTQKAWTAWMSEHGGAVVNIASVGALRTTRILGVYGMSKAALLYQSRQLAAELAPYVRVNTILPGLIRTDFARVLWEGERGAEVAAGYPLKRLGEPTDVANAALYLASDASSWMTGQELVLDGGGTVGFAEG